MTTAFVLSGGGSLGAVQVGMLQALSERAVHPDLLIGTSVGAINAAYVAGHGTSRQSLDNLAAVWRGLRRHEVFPVNPLRHRLALAGARPSLCSNRGVARLLDAHFTYRNLQDATIAVHIVTTNLLGGEEVLLSRGNAARAVLASTAIPGVFPAVEHDGLTLVDGGIADNAARRQSHETCTAAPRSRRPRSPINCSTTASPTIVGATSLRVARTCSGRSGRRPRPRTRTMPTRSTSTA